jgi:sec-independent protein translocase protein TatA
VTPSPIQLIIVLIIVLLLFGAKKIPELAKGLGTGMKEFRQGASGEIEEDKKDDAESKTDKESANASASDSGQDARSEDDSSATGDTQNAEGSGETSKTEQRS